MAFPGWFWLEGESFLAIVIALGGWQGPQSPEGLLEAETGRWFSHLALGGRPQQLNHTGPLRSQLECPQDRAGSFPRVSDEREREGGREGKVSVFFCDGVTRCEFCHIVFVRN